MNSRRIERRVAAAVAALVLGGSLPADGSAPSLDLRVAPTLLDLRLERGERAVRLVRLANAGDETLDVRASVSDWSMDADGTVGFASPGSTTRSCARAIELVPDRLRVPAGGTAEVAVIVRGSDTGGVPPGTRWAAILFELPELEADGDTLPVAFRVATTVYVTDGNAMRSPVVIAPPDEPHDGNAREGRLGAVVSNRGEQAVRFDVAWIVSDAEGSTVGEVRLADQVVLPRSRRNLTATLAGPLARGDYEVSVRLDTVSGGTGSRSVSYPLSVP